jgi:exodeoxyribonuclease VII small subunit
MSAFEQSLARLEAIVESMEREELPLDRALALFEEGIEQLRTATEELGRAEASVKILTERARGVLETLPLEG